MVVSVILARGLGPAEFGIYGVIISVLTWTQLLLNGGVPGATAKLLAQQPERAASIEQTARAVLISAGLALFAGGWLAAPALARLLGIPSAADVLRVALLDLPLMAAYFAWQGALYGRARFGTLALGLVVHSLLKLVGVVLLAFLGLSVTGAILAQVAASVGVLGYLFAVVPPSRTMPALELARPMLMMALPLSLYAMAFQIHVNLGLWLLSAAGTAGDAIGFFVAALNRQPHFDDRTVRAVGRGLRFDVAGACAAGRGDSTASFGGGGAPRAPADRSRGGAPDRRRRSRRDAPVRLGLRPGGRHLALAIGRLRPLSTARSVLHGLGSRWPARLSGLAPGCADRSCRGALSGPRRQPWRSWAPLRPRRSSWRSQLHSQHWLTWRRFRTLLAPLTFLRVGCATALTALISAQISVAGPWLVAKLAALFAVWLMILVLLRELTLADLKPFAIWDRSAA